MLPGAKRWLLLAVAAAFLVSFFSAHYNRYYLGVAIDVGINVILAVGLNLISGHTGHLSLVHAGFIGEGGYTPGKRILLAACSSTVGLAAGAQPLFFFTSP